MTYAINQLIHEYGASFSSVFRSITSDNGAEFAQLSESLRVDRRVFLPILIPHASEGRTKIKIE